MTAAVRAAFTLLTVLPLRVPKHLDRRTAGRAMTLAPLVGLVLGLMTAVVVVTLRIFTTVHGAPPSTLLPAAVGIATLALLTRGLHLDGLADVADGLGAGGSPQRRLAAMRDSAIGAFGAITVGFVVLVQVAALSLAIGQHRGTMSILVASMSGRLAVAFACTPRTPAARPEGLGHLVAGSVSRQQVGLSLVGVLFLAALAGRFDIDGGDAGRAFRAVAAVLVACAAAHLAREYLVRRFGGITGDVLGALVEIAATTALLVMVLTVPDDIQVRLSLS